MTGYHVTPTAPNGDPLHVTRDLEAPNGQDVDGPGAALALATRRTAWAYDLDSGTWRRRRVARWTLYALPSFSHGESYTPERAAATCARLGIAL